MSFGCRGSQKSSQLEESWQLLVALGGACKFCRFSGRHAHESGVHFGHPFGTEIEKSGAEPAKKHGQHSKQRKVQFPMPFFVAHFVAQTVNTICFEGSAHVHLNGFGVALGAIWGHFLTTLRSKVPIWTSQGVSKKLSQKRFQKRATTNLGPECVGP